MRVVADVEASTRYTKGGSAQVEPCLCVKTNRVSVMLVARGGPLDLKVVPQTHDTEFGAGGVSD